jgi:hypothetical protein
MRLTIPLVVLATAAAAVALPTEARQNDIAATDGTTTDLNSTSTFTKRDFVKPRTGTTRCSIEYKNH